MKIWYGESTVGLELYVVSKEAIYLSSESKEGNGENIEKKLIEASSLVSIMPKDTETVMLTSINRISADMVRNEIEIAYTDGKDERDRTMLFNNKVSFDAAYVYLKGIFGDAFAETEDRYSAPRAAYGALWAFTVFGFLTWIFYRMAEKIADEGYDSSKKQVKLLVSVLELLGTIGVAVVGGIILSLVVIYMISRIRKPPVYLILHKEKYKQSGPIRVAFNYLILGVVWVLMLRIMLL